MVMKVALVIVVFIAAAAVAVFALNRPQPVPQAGDPAPDFRLPSQDGSQIALSDLRGKWAVLYFYPKDGTSGCTIEAHNFQRDIAKYEALNAMVVGVSVDSASSHQDFCAKQGLTFKLLADTDKIASHEYGSVTNLLVTKIATRNTFLIDPSGKVAKVWLGVNPSAHSEEVLAELNRLRSQP
jgi:peroxiredoxin Q/BCP